MDGQGDKEQGEEAGEGAGLIEMEFRGITSSADDEENERTALRPAGPTQPQAAAAGDAAVPWYRSGAFFGVVGAALFLGCVIGVAVGLSTDANRGRRSNGEAPVAKIAFGSCTSYNLGYQPIWESSVVPAAPDAWIWGGDFSYLDDPMINCNVDVAAHTETWQSQCNCTNDWIKRGPHSCMAGDIDNAQNRWLAQLRDPGYAAFLEYMCPEAVAKGYWPPPGTDLTLCPRSIIGTWDDHDSGWNDGNSRLPQRQLYKKLYLDALGDPGDSPRRGGAHGIFYQFTLNEFAAGTQASLYETRMLGIHRPDTMPHRLPLDLANVGVDVFLLDERYQRDAIPCERRREWCEDVVLADPGHNRYAWCDDFVNGGADGGGSCCGKDQALIGWCERQDRLAPPGRSAHYDELCDVSNENYGMASLALNATTDDYEAPDFAATAADIQADTPFCDVLGRRQRAWLRETLLASTARLKLIVSGSVLIGNPEESPCEGGDNNHVCRCSGDDLECYDVAKRELAWLVHEATLPGESCALVLVGDYHMSDFRQIRPGRERYAESFGSSGFTKPIIQFMSSGLTDVTAHGHACEAWNADPLGMRVNGSCRFVDEPSFGMLRLEDGGGELVQRSDDKIQKVRMQIIGVDGSVREEEVLDMDTCTLET